MKYPKCCYRGENIFITADGVKAVSMGVIIGDRIACHEFGKAWTWMVGDEQELISITAETLAELARENDDILVVWFEFRDGKTLIEINGEESVQNKDEPLGEFFLRVAKERRYIKA